ncbi:MAG: VOC family protein [Hyphomonadaceae bacterium]|nr:VOC family protein [Hyphomonadaceae bacterium]
MNAAIAALGPIMQNAYVPADFDAALSFWTKTMGVGPFFLIEHVTLEDVRYRGASADIDFSIAIAYWGDMQIELIKQHNDAPSIYKSWRDAGKSGLHHVCLLTEDFAAARAATAGMEVLQEAKVPGGGEVIYVDTGGGDGTMVEILKSAPGAHAFFAMMQAAARDWTGADPVRRLG